MTRSGRRGSRPSGRRATVKVKTAKRRKASSTRWLQRQLNDPYVAETGRHGYRSRAAWKLLQLDEKFGLLRRGMRIVDLGAAPGGWTQVAAERTGEAARGRILAVDRVAMEPVPGAERLALDIFDDDAADRIAAALGGPADLVLSDMSAPTTGHRSTDHLRNMVLCEAAHELARHILAPGGTLVVKAFQGSGERDLVAALRRDFAGVRQAKPPASRAESPEMYIVASGFRGAGDGA